MIRLKLTSLPFALALALAAWLGVEGLAFAADTPATAQRVPWTTSRIQGSPDPAKPFIASHIHPSLTFREVTEIVFDTTENRWLILERLGKIYSLPHGADAAAATLVADLKTLHPDLGNLYGFAFHPKFPENRHVFITYTLGPKLEDGTKLSRFTLAPTANGESATANLTDESVILTWLSGGHNGAHLQFGPDGFLYVTTGDAEVPSPPDPLNTGQDITDLLSSILRIDVDKQDPGLAYAIPKDNPFINTPQARPEIWAYGLRNPWKMSFDRATGRLWCGDVGWELWEMIHLIERGGNYGWSAMEASQPIRADAPKAPTPIRPPVAAHSHDEAASITGGYVYHGRKFPELKGAYIYGDWETGKIWALWHDGTQVTRREEIADTPHKIITFAQDADGEIIYAHYGPEGTLHTLVRNPDAGKPNTFPRKLSETGLFVSLGSAGATPSPGVYPFRINAPMWQADAEGSLLLALPDTGVIETKADVKRPKDGRLTWPKDAVLAKTLSLKLKDAASPSPIETQLLHYDGEAWQAYTYRWNDSASDAELVPSQGDERVLALAGDRKLHWRFHARAECMRCHNIWVNGPLAFKHEQLAGLPPQTPGHASQIEELAALGLVDAAFAKTEPPARLVEWIREGLDDARARSYLHANCAHCHRKNAGGAVTMMLNAELPMDQMVSVGVPPMQGGLGLDNPKLIDPGNPWNSVISVRLAKSGAGHMPLIGQPSAHEYGLKLVEDWIARMTPGVASAADLLPKDWSESLLREKLATVDGAMQVRRAVDDGLLNQPLRVAALGIAWNSPHQTVRDLFDRFKPDDQREITIGLSPDVPKLLDAAGDAKRGSAVLSLQGKLATCYACHLVNGTGRDFGPDLSKIGTRMNREQLLESLLQPSKVINQSFAAISAETKDGAIHAGFVVKEDRQELTIKTATGQSVTLPRSSIKTRTKLPGSLMPEGQLQSLTAQEVADVLAYLQSLQ